MGSNNVGLWLTPTPEFYEQFYLTPEEIGVRVVQTCISVGMSVPKVCQLPVMIANDEYRPFS